MPLGKARAHPEPRFSYPAVVVGVKALHVVLGFPSGLGLFAAHDLRLEVKLAPTYSRAIKNRACFLATERTLRTAWRGQLSTAAARRIP